MNDPNLIWSALTIFLKERKIEPPADFKFPELKGRDPERIEKMVEQVLFLLMKHHTDKEITKRLDEWKRLTRAP